MPMRQHGSERSVRPEPDGPNSEARWIAIASYIHPEHLAATIRELIQLGYDAGRLCLIATGERIDAMLRSSEGKTLGSLLGVMDEMRIDGVDVLLLASPGRFQMELENSLAIAPDMLKGVRVKLRSGAALLLVAVKEFAHLAKVTRVLLRHSLHHVQTRQFAGTSPIGGTAC